MARTTHVLSGASLILDRNFREQARLAWRLLRDERVSALKYALPALVALYVFSPVDTIPDLFFGLGQMDDLGIVIVALLLLVRLIPRLAPDEVVWDHLREMGVTQLSNRPPAYGTNRVVDANYSVRGDVPHRD